MWFRGLINSLSNLKHRIVLIYCYVHFTKAKLHDINPDVMRGDTWCR